MVMVMVMNDLLPSPLCNVNQPSHSEIQLFQNLTMKIHGQSYVYTQRSRSRLTFKIQRSRSNPLVTFEAWRSINMFAFRFTAIGPLLAEIQQILYLTLKSQGQGHGQGETRSHIWALEFNWYVCFQFRGNRTVFGWDIENSIFDLEKSRSRSWSRSHPMVTFEP